jgi:hypothetical protein
VFGLHVYLEGLLEPRGGHTLLMLTEAIGPRQSQFPAAASGVFGIASKDSAAVPQYVA